MKLFRDHIICRRSQEPSEIQHCKSVYTANAFLIYYNKLSDTGVSVSQISSSTSATRIVRSHDVSVTSHCSSLRVHLKKKLDMPSYKSICHTRSVSSIPMEYSTCTQYQFQIVVFKITSSPAAELHFITMITFQYINVISNATYIT